MKRATRTVNPLHFEDLEPHRFEDLVRQLVYDLRNWMSIEATGRAGAEKGMDIRAVERAGDELQDADDEGDTGIARDVAVIDRVWKIQCKRCRHMGPKRIRQIVEENLTSEPEAIHAYMLAAPCDFSRAAREAFREEASRFGVSEFHLWGKGELEDRLFTPRYDHLLFAYFGISLQVKRRSLRTQLRSDYALKKRLVKVLGDIRKEYFESVLILDPMNADYPDVEDPKEFIKSPAWRYWTLQFHHPRRLIFLTRECLAWIDWDAKRADVLRDRDLSWRPWDLHGIPWELARDDDTADRYRRFWGKHVPEEQRGYLREYRGIPYDRILAFDTIGDCFNDGPHLIVDFGGFSQPFDEWGSVYFEPDGRIGSRRELASGFEKAKLFPRPIPEERPEQAGNEE